jgi:hypothetical protein
MFSSFPKAADVEECMRVLADGGKLTFSLALDALLVKVGLHHRLLYYLSYLVISQYRIIFLILLITASLPCIHPDFHPPSPYSSLTTDLTHNTLNPTLPSSPPSSPRRRNQEQGAVSRALPPPTDPTPAHSPADPLRKPRVSSRDREVVQAEGGQRSTSLGCCRVDQASRRVESVDAEEVGWSWAQEGVGEGEDEVGR